MERKFISTLSRLIGAGGTAAQAQSAGTNGPAATRAERPNKAYLSAMRIFRDLSADEIKVVERSTVMTTAPKGKIVYQPEETGEILFLIKTGSVHLYRVSSEGRKFIVQTIAPMTFFG